MTQSTAIKIASEKALKYAEKQHMYRAMNIARTELAFAYNRGEFESVKQAVRQGYMGHTVKRWITAGDNRVCPICRSLEGEEAELESEYNIKSKSDGLTPPAHPSCRCCLEYFEIEPPNKIIANNNIVDETPQASAQTFNEILETNEISSNNELMQKLISLVEDYNNLPSSIQSRINHDFNLIPDKHKDIILSEVKKIIIAENIGSCYHRPLKIVFSGFDSFNILHELGHAIETKLELHHNAEYLAVLGKGLEDVNFFNVVEEKFDKVVNGEVEVVIIPRLELEESKFISEYQQRLYPEDLDNAIIVDNGVFNIRTLGEYFSEGYREYLENPENLKAKDIELYNFIKGL